MAGERTYPVLPCADLDDALEFYAAIGFTATFIQRRPYACAVVARHDLHIHLSMFDGFDPEASYASVIITVPEPGEMHAAFTAGLKEHYGKVPLKGIPRILPLRRKAGTATGFSVVDAGGNWLRFYRSPRENDEPEEAPRTGLARIIDVAARQGDSRGDEAQGISVLDSGLIRYPDAPAGERFEALLYRAELKMRIGGDAARDLAEAESLANEHELGADAAAQVERVREAIAE